MRREPDAERIHSLDILRGLALFAMILVHFHQKMRIEVAGLEDLIGWGVYVLVEQKAWGTFALLFGVGFAVLLRRLEARGAPVAVTFLRRMAVLALFGVIAEVGFGFQILLSYACWGVPLLLVRRWSTRALLLTALLAAMARPLAGELVALWSWWSGTPLPVRPGRALAQAVEAAAAGGSYLELLAARWRLFAATTPWGWRAFLPDVNFALFLVGLLAVRHGVIDQPLRHVRLIARWMLFGALSWLTYWLVLRRLPDMAIPGARWPFEAGLGVIQEQWLCFTYAGAGLLLLARRPGWVSRLAPIGQAGRMALTNYMLQAAVLDALASGYGAALRLRPFHYLIAAPLLFGAEIALARLWLSRFLYGPLEWIWRTGTYARAQPLRRAG